MMSKRGQTGIEVMAMLGIVLFLSAIVLFSLNERNLNVERSRQQLGAQGQVTKVADAISSAAIGGEGFQVNMTVRKTAGPVGADVFRILGTGRRVEMRWQGPRNETLLVAVPLITEDVTTADIVTGFINVNNTGDNIEVKCWNDAKTQASFC